MKFSWPWSSPTWRPSRRQSRITPSLPAEAKSAFEGWSAGTRQSALTTSVLALTVCSSFPEGLNILMCLSAHPKLLVSMCNILCSLNSHTCDNSLLVICQYCPHAPLMSLEHRLALPLPYSPHSCWPIPTAADYKVALGTSIQCTHIMAMSKKQCFSVIVRWFPRLPNFYYCVLPAGYHEAFWERRCWLEICNCIDKRWAMRRYGTVIFWGAGGKKLP